MMSKSVDTLFGADLAQLAASAAAEKKAEGLAILDISLLNSYTDFLVICQGSSDRQTQAIVRHIEDVLQKSGKRPFSIEGFEQGQWILLDYGDVIVHAFHEDARHFYDLDGFWSTAPRVKINETAQLSATIV